MKLKIIILLGLTLALITSCQDEVISNDVVDTIEVTDPAIEDVTVPVNFSASFNRMISSIGHEPMTRAEQNLPLIQISNNYSVLIMKDVDGRWILDKILENKFNPNDRYNINPVRITEENAANVVQFQTDLRPGNYRMTIFTGTSSMTKNTMLKPGLWVEDNDIPQMAYTYRIVEQGYLNPGERHLQEEIFAGWEYFEVEKTTDLHSESLVQNVHVMLDRKVAKLRFFLKYEESESGFNFFNDYQNAIVAQMDLVEGSQPFPNGLDIWGDPYYDTTNPITQMYYGVFCWKKPLEAENGNLYLSAMKNSTRQFSAFYFTDPQYDISVAVSNVEVSASTFIRINYIYAAPAAEVGYDTGDPFHLALQHNTQFGIVFSTGNDDWSDPRDSGSKLRTMVLDLESPSIPVDHTDLFPYAQEYDNSAE